MDIRLFDNLDGGRTGMVKWIDPVRGIMAEGVHSSARGTDVDAEIKRLLEENVLRIQQYWKDVDNGNE